MFGTPSQKSLNNQVLTALLDCEGEVVAGSFTHAKESVDTILGAAVDMEELLESMKTDVAMAQLRLETMLAAAFVRKQTSSPEHAELTVEKQREVTQRAQEHADRFAELESHRSRVGVVREYLFTRQTQHQWRGKGYGAPSSRAHMQRVAALLEPTDEIQHPQPTEAHPLKTAEPEHAPKPAVSSLPMKRKWPVETMECGSRSSLATPRSTDKPAGPKSPRLGLGRGQ